MTRRPSDHLFEPTDSRFNPRERGRFGDNESSEMRGNDSVRSNLIDLDLYQHAKTQRGVLVSDGRKDVKSVWLPLLIAQVHATGKIDRVWDYDRSRASQLVKVTLPDWLAKKEGLI